MAIKQEIVCTCLPNGRGTGRSVKMSLLLSPRLSGGTKLSSFLFDDWATRASELWTTGFDVMFGKRRAIFVGDDDDYVGRSDLWSILFPPETFVRSYQVEKVDKTKIASYSVANVVQFTQARLTSVAALAPSKALSAETLAKDGLFGQIAQETKVAKQTVGGYAAAENKKVLDKLLRESETRRLEIEALERRKLNPSLDFYRVQDFYHRRNQARRVPAPPGGGGADKRLDFHQMVALLGNYPQLERLLALVFDFEVQVPQSLSFDGTLAIRVFPRWSPDGGPQPVWVSPATMTRMGTFRADPRPKPRRPDIGTPRQQLIRNGKLNLSNVFGDGKKVFELTQVDPDAAAFSMKRFADRVTETIKVNYLNSKGVAGAPAKRADEETPLIPPSLKAPGLSLSRAGRAAALASSLERQVLYSGRMLSAKSTSAAAALGAQGRAKAPDVVLFAEDLVRGYAIDIYDEEVGRWFPLCTREGEARFIGDGTVTEPIQPEDGWISPAVTKAPLGSGLPRDRIEIHETMFRWSNWSLAVTRPGKTVNANEEAENVKNVAATEFPLEVEYKIPSTPAGVLPILRYGRRYRARARVVDLAGNATPFGSPTAFDPSTSSGQKVFDRLEPGPPPVLIMRDRVTPAESLEHMVIRSNVYDGVDSLFPSVRHVISPKIDQVSAELHGMFDTPTGLDTSLDTYKMIRAREKGSVDEKNEDGQFVHPGAQRDPDNYDQPYFDVDQIQFYVEDGELAGAPYLPDPLCHGAAFVGLPTDSEDETPMKVPLLDGSPPWPSSDPFRLRLQQGEAGYTLNPGVLDVFLPPATVVDVDYSSYHDENDLTRLGLMRWIAEAAEQPELDDEADDEFEHQRYRLMQWINLQARLRGFAARGARQPALQFMQEVARDSRNRSWWKKASPELKQIARIAGGTHAMVMPSRRLRLVHAVRRPLDSGMFGSLKTDRAVNAPPDLRGRTYANLSDANISVHRRSTAMLEATATWVDVSDHFETLEGEGGESEWVPRGLLQKNEIVHRFDPGAPGTDMPAFKFRQEFHDTKYRQVTYSLEATTRFKEYFVDSETLNWSGDETKPLPPSPELLGQTGVVPDSEKVYVPQSARDANPSLGSTYIRGDHYLMDYDAGTISRIGNAIPTGQDIKVEYLSPPLTTMLIKGRPSIKIASTARPHAPDVSFIVPTFGWNATQEGSHIESTRRGRTLRVYLRRPWWTSGDGELLGVLFGNPTDKNYTTRMGMDPIFRSEPSAEHLTASHFPLAVASRQDLSLDERGNRRYSVAGHPVDFDLDRQLWFCDIEVKTPSYFPFIRLALARFQPNSINGAHLSRVVTGDFIQLAPDRTASVFVNEKARTAEVSVSGRAYLRTKDRVGPTRVEVTVEQTRLPSSDVNNEMGWIQVGAPERLQHTQLGENRFAWSGTVALPQNLPLNTLRLVVREFEMLRKSGSTVFGIPMERRLVYADTILLDVTT